MDGQERLVKTVISLCSVDGCSKPKRGRGMCSMHYQRYMKHGSTEPPARPSPEERFWAKVEKSDGCWTWTAATYSNGYGHFGLNETRGVIAHRYAWEQARGPIPQGKILDHTCHNRACVNPRHLRLATVKQNLENQGVLRRDNTSGIRGVGRYRDGRRWVVRATHDQKDYHGGIFEDVIEAERAAIALRNKLFTHNDLDRRRA